MLNVAPPLLAMSCRRACIKSFSHNPIRFSFARVFNLGAEGTHHDHERVLRSTPGTLLVQLNTPCSEVTADEVSALEAYAVAAIADIGVDGVNEETISISSNCLGHLDMEGDM